MCRLGHDDWRPRRERPHVIYCRTCKRLANKLGARRWSEFPTHLLRRAAEKILRIRLGVLDHDDLMQEARLAIWLARKRWRQREGVDWVAFGVTVAQRAMIDTLRTVAKTRLKATSPRVLADSALLEPLTAAG